MNFLRQKIIDKYSRGGEEIPHCAWSVVPRFCIFACYIFSLEVLYSLFPDMLYYIIDHFAVGLAFLSVMMFIIYVIRPIVALYNSYHEMALDNLISVQGFASPLRREHLCPYMFIVGVEVSQNIFDRITDMGKLSIGTAMTGHAEIILKNIQRPNEYAEKIMERVGESAQE